MLVGLMDIQSLAPSLRIWLRSSKKDGHDRSRIRIKSKACTWYLASAACCAISVILCPWSFLAGNTSLLLPGLLCRAIRPLTLVTRSFPSTITCTMILVIFGLAIGVWNHILLLPGGPRLARCLSFKRSRGLGHLSPRDLYTFTQNQYSWHGCFFCPACAAPCDSV